MSQIWLKETRKGMIKQLFYLEILVILLEGYLEFVIAFFLQINSDESQYYWISIIIGAVIFFLLPILILYIATRKKECLEHEHIKDRFEVFYVQFDTD